MNQVQGVVYGQSREINFNVYSFKNNLSSSENHVNLAKCRYSGLWENYIVSRKCNNVGPPFEECCVSDYL